MGEYGCSILKFKIMKQTLGEQRFRRFLINVKKANTDKELLLAGHQLMEEYKGFGSLRNSMSVLNKIDKIVKENEFRQIKKQR